MTGFYRVPNNSSDAGPDDYRPERYETFDGDDGQEDQPVRTYPGTTRLYGFNRHGSHSFLVPTASLMQSAPAAQCANCMSTRKTVQRDREIRAGAVCCGEVA